MPHWNRPGRRGLIGQCDRCLRRVAEEGQGLIQIQANSLGVMAEVTDRYIGAQLQVKIPARVLSTKAPSIAGAQMISPSTSRLRCSRIG